MQQHRRSCLERLDDARTAARPAHLAAAAPRGARRSRADRGHQIIERLRGEQEALEREVLFHADRADALEDALGAAQRQNGGLAVLAHR